MSDGDHSYKVEVLRLGHRPERDKRITTHVSLVARAFGSDGIHIDTKDTTLEKTVNSVVSRFGGDFWIETGISRKSVMNRWNGTIVHLTMYGASLNDVIDDIPRDDDLLVIVGAEKVPPDVYDNAHFNISVSNQPHSEVSALALFLDRYFEGRELDREFSGGEVKIHPTNKGKVVTDSGAEIDIRTMDPFKRTWDPVPLPDDCFELLKLLGTSKKVIQHVKEVHRLGMELLAASQKTGKKMDIDVGLLEAGLILHDIGRARTHSIRHVTLGIEIAVNLGLDERLISIIRSHIGGGVPAEEAVKIGLPEEDHIPITIEEKMVCHCDNLVGSHRRRPLSIPVERLKEKGAEKAAQRMISLHEELENILGIDIDRSVDGSS